MVHVNQEECGHLERTTTLHSCPLERVIFDNEAPYCQCCAECERECSYRI